MEESMTVSSLKQPVIRLIDQSPSPPTQNPKETTRIRRRKSPIDLPAREQEGLVTKENLIKNTPLFAELTAEEQCVIAKWMKLKNYQADETLFVKDSQSDTLYLIQEGWVKLSIDVHNGQPVVTSLGPGSLLGATDFLLGRVRTMSAYVSGRVTVWALDNSDLYRIIAQHPNIGLSLGLAFGTGIAQFQTHLADKLASIPLLQDLSKDERNVVAQHLSPHRYLPRETIYRCGDPPTGIFFIEGGQVWLLSETDDYIELGPGQTFGERAVIADKPHSHTAQAATEVILWQLSPADFTILADTYPSIKSNLSRNLHASLSEALTIASLILDGEIEALRVACGQKNDLVRKLHQVRHTLAWLKASRVLF
jgi:CRP-like cAMP-binding protein